MSVFSKNSLGRFLKAGAVLRIVITATETTAT